MSRAGSIKRDASGQWVFVVDLAPAGAPRRQVRRRGFATKKAAQEALDVLKGTVRTGTYVEPARLTFGQYLTGWLEGLATSGRRAPTIASYKSKINAYVIGRPIADIPVQGLTATDLDALYSELLARGSRAEGKLAHRTVRYTHTVIRKALADAERRGVVARNVAALAEPPTSAASRPPEPKVWTPVELKAFLDNTADLRHGPMFRLLGMTGMRRGEAVGLRWSDVDLEAGSLTVRHTITAVDGVLVEGTGKTARARRVIELDPATVKVLKVHRQAQREERMLMGAGYTDRGLVFSMPDGQPYNPDVITKNFARSVKSAGAPPLHLHGLRHTHATHLLAAGTNPRVVSERLGHASVAFTLDTYGHVLDGQQATAAEAVAALVDGP